MGGYKPTYAWGHHPVGFSMALELDKYGDFTKLHKLMMGGSEASNFLKPHPNFGDL